MGDIEKGFKKLEKNYKELEDEITKPIKEVGKGIEKGFDKAVGYGNEAVGGLFGGASDLVGSIGSAGSEIIGAAAPVADSYLKSLTGGGQGAQQYAERKIASVPQIQTTQEAPNNTMMYVALAGIAGLLVFMLTKKKR